MTRNDIERTEKVRPSRDGDQFHYLRGARLTLELLPPSSTLVAVTVEGVTADDDSDEGLDVIDLALYYGSEDPTSATGVHYRQFKHSTRSPEKAWTASGLKRTLAGFGRRFRDQVTKHGLEVVENNHQFEFETNRPIDAAVHAVFASGPADLTTRAARYLRKASGLTAAEFGHFRQLVTLIPNVSDFLGQRRLLERDTAGFLPERDRDASLRLKDLVTRKATTEHERNPTIRRTDVLDELEVEADRLYPAPLAIETPSPYVEREQTDTLARDILHQSGPAIITADGGVGKSIIVTTLGTRFPVGSRTYVYDCFGNGAYRSATGYRHRPQDGLVQLANEMATQGLCDLLLPNARADAAAYVRAFMARVRQASASMAQLHPAAMLTIVVDAADNAEMQAAELKDGPSFPRLLLQETYPDNVRLVLTARPHRVSDLDPPSTTRRLPLEPFSLAETHAHLRGLYPATSNEQAQEFHRLTSHNPRVQALYLDAGRSLTETLAMLGTTPRTVDQTIHDGLRQTVDRLPDGPHPMREVTSTRTNSLNGRFGWPASCKNPPKTRFAPTSISPAPSWRPTRWKPLSTSMRPCRSRVSLARRTWPDGRPCCTWPFGPVSTIRIIPTSPRDWRKAPSSRMPSSTATSILIGAPRFAPWHGFRRLRYLHTPADGPIANLARVDACWRMRPRTLWRIRCLIRGTSLR